MIANMIANPMYKSKEMPIYTDRVNSLSLSIKGESVKQREPSKKIVPFHDDIVYIEGTLLVAF